MNTKKYHSSAIRRFGQQKTLLKHIHRSERQAAVVDSPAYQAHTFNGGGICGPITDTVMPLNSWSPFLNRSHRLFEKYMASKGNAVGEMNLDAWPDYVFAKDYALPTLAALQQHINEKGHLPNIPSAVEIEANGLELGEMNKLLLEKIEELTLYILQQEARIKTLEKSNE